MELKYVEVTMDDGNVILAPDLELPPPPKPLAEITYWGEKRYDFIKKHRPGLFNELAFTNTMNAHLASVQEAAEAYEEKLMESMTKADGVTEELKEKDMLEWAARMNGIAMIARDTVMREIICV